MTLRTYTTFELWREGTRLTWIHRRELLTIVLPGTIVVVLLAIGVATGIRFQSNPMPTFPGIGGGQQALLMMAAVPLIGALILVGCLTVLVFSPGILYWSYAIIGKPISLKACFQRLLRFFFPFIGSLTLAFSINSAVALAGLLIMVVPGPVLGLLFYVWYHFVPAVVLVEGEGGGGALKRSRALTREFFWKVSAVVTTPLVLEFVLVGQVLMFASDLLYRTVGLGWWSLPAIVITVLLLLLLEGWKLMLGVLIYYDLRIRKDGLDVPMLSRELEEYSP